MRTLATLIAAAVAITAASACTASEDGADSAWPERSVGRMADSLARGETLLTEELLRGLVEAMPEIDARRGRPDWAEQSAAIIEAAGFAGLEEYVKAVQKAMTAATVLRSLRNLEEARAGSCRCKRMSARIARLEESTRRAIAGARLTRDELRLVFRHRVEIDKAARGYFAAGSGPVPTASVDRPGPTG